MLYVFLIIVREAESESNSPLLAKKLKDFDIFPASYLSAIF